MKKVKITFEEETLTVDYEWIDRYCQDINLVFYKDDDKNTGIVFATEDIFVEIKQRYYETEQRTMWWIVIAYDKYGNRILETHNRYKEAKLTKMLLKEKGYSVNIIYGFM